MLTGDEGGDGREVTADDKGWMRGDGGDRVGDIWPAVMMACWGE